MRTSAAASGSAGMSRAGPGWRASIYSMMPVASKTRLSPSVSSGNVPIGQSAANSPATGSLPSSIFVSKAMPFS